jgi:hypothetical protein
MNQKWWDFNQTTGINIEDLWPSSTISKNLFNAKLYPIFNTNMTQTEFNLFRKNFWFDLIKMPKDKQSVKKWRESHRLSLEEIGSIVNLEKTFETRRILFNRISAKHLVDSVIQKRPINFNALIKNCVHDGFSDELLKLFDEGIHLFYLF